MAYLSFLSRVHDELDTTLMYKDRRMTRLKPVPPPVTVAPGIGEDGCSSEGSSRESTPGPVHLTSPPAPDPLTLLKRHSIKRSVVADEHTARLSTLSDEVVSREAIERTALRHLHFVVWRIHARTHLAGVEAAARHTIASDEAHAFLRRQLSAAGHVRRLVEDSLAVTHDAYIRGRGRISQRERSEREALLVTALAEQEATERSAIAMDESWEQLPLVRFLLIHNRMCDPRGARRRQTLDAIARASLDLGSIHTEVLSPPSDTPKTSPDEKERRRKKKQRATTQALQDKPVNYHTWDEEGHQHEAPVVKEAPPSQKKKKSRRVSMRIDSEEDEQPQLSPVLRRRGERCSQLDASLVIPRTLDRPDTRCVNRFWADSGTCSPPVKSIVVTPPKRSRSISAPPSALETGWNSPSSLPNSTHDKKKGGRRQLRAGNDLGTTRRNSDSRLLTKAHAAVVLPDIRSPPIVSRSVET